MTIQDRNTQVKTPRVAWVDAAKAISICLVVLLHVVMELEFVGVQSRWINDAMPLMGTIRMPLFFTASGLFAVSWVTRRSWNELLNRKIALLAWVFLVWQPVVLCYKLAEMWWLPNQPSNTLLTQVSKIVLSPLRPNGELWFLWALALFFSLAWLTRRIPAYLQVGVALLVSVAWTYAAEALISDSALRALGPGVNGAFTYYAFFIGGVLFSAQIQAFFVRLHPALALLIFGAWIGFHTLLTELELSVIGLPLIMSIAAVAAGLSVATLIARSTWVSWLGANTLQVYVAHLVFIVAMTIALYHAGLQEQLSRAPEVAILLMTITSIFLACGIHWIAYRAGVARYLYEQPKWFRLARK